MIAPLPFQKDFTVYVKQNVTINGITLTKDMRISISKIMVLPSIILPSNFLIKKLKAEIIMGFLKQYNIDLSRNWEIFRHYLSINRNIMSSVIVCR